MRDAIHRRRWRDDQSGMSLVEIMIAVFVLSVGLLALASTAITSIVNIRVSRGRQEATDAASATIEDLRRSDFALVALDANDPDVGALGDCETELDEPYVVTSQSGAIPHVQTFGQNGHVTVTTTVTWYDEAENGPQTCTATDHDRRVKRVQVTAEWTDSGETHSLMESTLVSEVDRGLPAPDFRLGTPEASIFFTPDDLTTQRERCVGHVLRNVGADDGYEWTATRVDSGSVEKNNAARYWTADGKFYLRAFFENTAQDPPVNPADQNVPKDQTDRHANLPAGLELMVDGTDSNSLPDTESKLDTGEQARLWVCYWTGSNAAVGDSAEFDVTVSSQFDPNRSETVRHEVEVLPELFTMYLFDDYVPDEDDTPTTAEASTNRVVTVKNKEILPVLPMGPVADAEPERLGSTSELPNYDTDFDTYPGLRLKDGPRLSTSESDWPASRVTFHEQISPTTTFKPTANIALWSASQAALDAQAAGASSVATERLVYRVQIQVLDKNENHVQATLYDQEHAYDHTAVGWDQVPNLTGLSLNNAADYTVDKDQYIQLHITCLATSTDTCHLAYDHQASTSPLYESALELVVKS